MTGPIPFLDLGAMPIANGFLLPSEVASEKRYPLRVGLDRDTSLVRLLDIIPPELLFHERYAFFSSTSRRMNEHFLRFAQKVKASIRRDGFVVEIGSNDGIMLQHFAALGMRSLGVEPSENVAKAARGLGLRVESAFFSEETAHKIARRDGYADAVVAANVVCHVQDPLALFRAVAPLLRPGSGIFIFEEPYLGDILRLCSYDQIYDEHASYFSLASVSILAEQAGLELVEVEHQETHGGSMRYTLAHKGSRAPGESVASWRETEEARGLADPLTFTDFAAEVAHRSTELFSLLTDLKRQGKRVAGYGATSKSTTVTNFAGIGPELVSHICDTTPGKIGKLSPGAHIPIVARGRWEADAPDYTILFAWNHADEILAKEQAYRDAGGKFIVYVPEVKVV